MYRRDQAIISEYARRNPENFARVLQFVILTARVRLANVPADFETAEQGGPDAMGVLFGWKFQAYTEVWKHREVHYTYCEDALRHARSEQELARDLIEYFAGLYGYGPAKAGFVTQLIYGIGGCLDTHNLKRFNIPSRTFDSYCQIKTAKARRRKIAKYVALVYKLGGPKVLWDTWCYYVADGQPALYRSADYVSALHVEALNLEEKTA